MNKVPELKSYTSLMQLWTVHTKGDAGKPALADLEEQYKASWRTYTITEADTPEQAAEKRKVTKSLQKRM